MERRNGITIQLFIYSWCNSFESYCSVSLLVCSLSSTPSSHCEKNEETLTYENNNLGKITFTLIVLYWRLPSRKSPSVKVFAAQFHWLCAAWLIMTLSENYFWNYVHEFRDFLSLHIFLMNIIFTLNFVRCINKFKSSQFASILVHFD